MKIETRKYEESDLEAVNEILKEAFNSEKKNFTGEEFYEIVATVEGEVAGYLLLTDVLNPVKDKIYCLVDYVCVSSKYRGLGVGKYLVDYAEEIAKGKNAMYLQLTCSRFRVAAHRLYEKCGYIMRDSDIYRKEIL